MTIWYAPQGGTARQNIFKRGKQQTHLNRSGYNPPELNRSSTNRNAIRGQEQWLINRDGGAISQGGSRLDNKINSVRPGNPRSRFYNQQRIQEFGK